MSDGQNSGMRDDEPDAPESPIATRVGGTADPISHEEMTRQTYMMVLGLYQAKIIEGHQDHERRIAALEAIILRKVLLPPGVGE